MSNKKIIKIIGGIPSTTLKENEEWYIADNPQLVVYEGDNLNQKLKDLGLEYDENELNKFKLKKETLIKEPLIKEPLIKTEKKPKK